jgi:hypothetical protein
MRLSPKLALASTFQPPTSPRTPAAPDQSLMIGLMNGRKPSG